LIIEEFLSTILLIMDETLKNIQNRIINYLKEYGSQPLLYLCKDNCSEISRLTSYWLYCDNPNNQYSIIKGTGIKEEKSHDVLAIKDSDKYYLVDPSIWQFFPEANNIYLGKFNSVEEISLFLENKYTGTWSVSEIMSEESFENRGKWGNIIKSNIQDNSDA